ncbi:hypothetical protein EPN28_01275 [Patescibacteria group bacterium]|nr:MAG: hypothetical protein EPN28_01275 [Patescibacteria group bacterium]
MTKATTKRSGTATAFVATLAMGIIIALGGCATKENVTVEYPGSTTTVTPPTATPEPGRLGGPCLNGACLDKEAVCDSGFCRFRTGPGSSNTCGNGACQADLGETYTTCPQDCGKAPGCPSGQCDPGESSATCPQDCPANTASWSVQLEIRSSAAGLTHCHTYTAGAVPALYDSHQGQTPLKFSLSFSEACVKKLPGSWVGNSNGLYAVEIKCAQSPEGPKTWYDEPGMPTMAGTISVSINNGSFLAVVPSGGDFNTAPVMEVPGSHPVANRAGNAVVSATLMKCP